MPQGSTLTSRRTRKPKLGQHFLRDQRAAGEVVEALGDVGQSTVLEIGPGSGMLTALLVRRARRLIAVEVDKVLAAQLRMRFAMADNIEVIEGDILSIDLDTIFGPKPGSSRPGLEYVPQPAQVVGNLPYYITSDILLRLFAYRRYFQRIVLMVQREVAERITAKPGTRDYGLLSATAQLYSQVTKLFTLPPGAFNPSPRVHSTVIRLTIAPQLERLQVAEESFIRFLKLSFAQKRKTLWNNLKNQYEAGTLRTAFERSRIKSSARAETLLLEQSAALFRELMSVDGSGSSS